MKCIYTLVSDDSDVFLEQTLVSVCSLKMHNPEIPVELVVDNVTAESLKCTRSEILKYVNSLVCVNLPKELTNREKSRHLKTNLREIVKGDYLYLDTDTLICGKLEEIENFGFEIGVVADLNGSLVINQDAIEKCMKAGFCNVEGFPYYNSGIMYVKDSPTSHALYREWHRLWKQSCLRGILYDQPALCQANANLGFPIKELPSIWNCQIKYFGKTFLKEAVIIHYFNTSVDNKFYGQKSIFEYVKMKGCVTPEIEKMIKNPSTIFVTALSIPPEMAFKHLTSYSCTIGYTHPVIFKFLEFVSYVLLKIRNL